MIPEAARLSRRSVVAVAAVGAVAGCSGGGQGGGSGAGAADAVPEPGAVARAQAVRDSTALLASYDAVLAAHPALAGRLAALRAEVDRHVRAFGGRPPAPVAPLPSPSARPSPARSGAGTGTGTGSSPVDTATPAAALASLAAMERALADRRAAALLTVPGETARLLASVAAAGAGHVVLLGARAEAEKA